MPWTLTTIPEQRIIDYKKWKKDWPKTQLLDITTKQPNINNILSFIDEYFATPAIFKQYKIVGCGGKDSKNIQIDKFHPYLHTYDLLNHPDITEDFLETDLLKVLGIEDPWLISEKLGLKPLNHFEFIASLASAIDFGGAYYSFPFKGEQALEKATLCYKEWAQQHRFNAWELSFYKMDNQWSSYFCDVAWDNAWVSYDFNSGVFCILLITDND
jgi:hypothetical protein